MSRKVGRISLAAALMIAGAVVLLDNILGTDFKWYVGRLWAALLIFLGLEWVAASTRAQREGSKTTVDPGALVGLLIVAVVAASVSNWRAPVRYRSNVINVYPNERVEIAIPQVTVTPALPFANVSADMVQTAPINLAHLQELTISTTSGDVTVQDGPNPLVEMRVRAYGRSTADAEALAREVQMLYEDRGNRVSVKALRPSSSGRLEVSFVVTLPKDANLDLKVDSSSGSVNVADRTGNVTVGSSSGSLRVERVKGAVDLRATSGTLRVTDIDGDVAANSSSGSVQIEGITGSVKVGATSGSIILQNVSRKVSAQSSSGTITVDSATLGGDWDVNAVSGGLRVTFPAQASVAVSARASSGRVSGPAWLTIGEGRNSGTGTQGDGAYKLNLRTSSGDIRVEVR